MGRRRGVLGVLGVLNILDDATLGCFRARRLGA